MPDFIAPLSERVGAAVLRLDRVLADAVKHGTRDVYLPNDTHWGSAGTRLAAEFVADEIFVPTPPKSAHPPPAAKPPPP